MEYKTTFYRRHRINSLGTLYTDMSSPSPNSNRAIHRSFSFLVKKNNNQKIEIKKKKLTRFSVDCRVNGTEYARSENFAELKTVSGFRQVIHVQSVGAESHGASASAWIFGNRFSVVGSVRFVCRSLVRQ